MIRLETCGRDADDGVAELIHMLISQAAEADPSRAALGAKLATPVEVSLRDIEGSCAVMAAGADVVVRAGTAEGAGVRIQGVSEHVVEVTQIRMVGDLLPLGLLSEPMGRSLVKDLTGRRLRISGLIRHYATACRFLALVNIRSQIAGRSAP